MMVTRPARPILLCGLVAGLLALTGCEVAGTAVADPSAQVDRSGIPEYRDLPFPVGETLVAGRSGRGPEHFVMETAGMGTYFAAYGLCLGDDVVVELVYEDDDSADAFRPICDGF